MHPLCTESFPRRSPSLKEWRLQCCCISQRCRGRADLQASSKPLRCAHANNDPQSQLGLCLSVCYKYIAASLRQQLGIAPELWLSGARSRDGLSHADQDHLVLDGRLAVRLFARVKPHSSDLRHGLVSGQPPAADRTHAIATITRGAPQQTVVGPCLFSRLSARHLLPLHVAQQCHLHEAIGGSECTVTLRYTHVLQHGSHALKRGFSLRCSGFLLLACLPAGATAKRCRGPWPLSGGMRRAALALQMRNCDRGLPGELAVVNCTGGRAREDLESGGHPVEKLFCATLVWVCSECGLPVRFSNLQAVCGGIDV